MSSEVCYSDSLDPKKAKGKIVICSGGNSENIEKGEEVIRAGGVGLIVVNNEWSGNAVTATLYRLPAINIGWTYGSAIYSYMNTTKSPTACISAPTTRLGVKPAPAMTDFSSRGPNTITPQILKPDVTAPGYMILAAYSGAASATGRGNDTRRVLFNMLSGTSMSCPHVAGLTGLLKTLYPGWSPAAIRSAIMTTARTRANNGTTIPDYDNKKATPFAYGSGHIRPNRAMDPGLVFDLSTTNYLDFLCALGYNASSMAAFYKKPYGCPSKPMNLEDLNYPSIAVPNLNGSLTVTRTVKNVGSPSTYRVRIVAPIDISNSQECWIPKHLSGTDCGSNRHIGIR
ncbi:uncharacterized protein A4U43_C05F7380 [Asparagus officinalis]|uniref:Peptidase S8/S53 domain-containing protein n=1 Tax=Asparagus officinalis TaxID=4686 RepID=A0A5P1EQL2_ASPOF|nr:uncharacterized protein A4U43_C05F7380 [Asparagus officinalis]